MSLLFEIQNREENTEIIRSLYDILSIMVVVYTVLSESSGGHLTITISTCIILNVFRVLLQFFNLFSYSM